MVGGPNARSSILPLVSIRKVILGLRRSNSGYKCKVDTKSVSMATCTSPDRYISMASIRVFAGAGT